MSKVNLGKARHNLDARGVHQDIPRVELVMEHNALQRPFSGAHRRMPTVNLSKSLY